MAPTRQQIVARMRLGDEPTIERLTRTFLAAKLDTYRSTLSGLRVSYGGPARVHIGPEIRRALLAEAERDAESVVATMNKLVAGEAERSPLTGDALARHLEGYARERAAARANFIARAEVAPARLDATVAFYRENGIEPLFDFVGPRAKCPICKALKEASPHTIEVAIAVGIPHIGCSHGWKARAYSAAKLAAGGLRPGTISAGRGPVAGIVGSEGLRGSLGGLDEQTIADAIRRGELARRR